MAPSFDIYLLLSTIYDISSIFISIQNHYCSKSILQEIILILLEPLLKEFVGQLIKLMHLLEQFAIMLFELRL